MIRAVRTAGARPRPDALTRSTTSWCATGASRRTCRPCSPMTLSVASAVALLATAAARWRATGTEVVLTMHDPALDESSGLARVGPAPGRAVDAQRRRPDRRGLRRRRATAAPSRTVTLRGIDPYDPEALAPGARRPTVARRCSSATSATTGQRRPDVSVFRFAEPKTLGRRRRSGRRGTGSAIRTARTTRRRCSSTRATAGSWIATKALVGGGAVPRAPASWSTETRAPTGSTPGRRRAGAGHRRRLPARRPVRAAHLHRRSSSTTGRDTRWPAAALPLQPQGESVAATATGCWSAARAGSRRCWPCRCPAARQPAPTPERVRRQPTAQPRRRRPMTALASWSTGRWVVAVPVVLLAAVARRRCAADDADRRVRPATRLGPARRARAGCRPPRTTSSAGTTRNGAVDADLVGERAEHERAAAGRERRAEADAGTGEVRPAVGGRRWLATGRAG